MTTDFLIVLSPWIPSVWLAKPPAPPCVETRSGYCTRSKSSQPAKSVWQRGGGAGDATAQNRRVAQTAANGGQLFRRPGFGCGSAALGRHLPNSHEARRADTVNTRGRRFSLQNASE